jgi:hypothetical protein
MNVYIHHFLLYSESPELTFETFKIKYDLPEFFPITNFGFFKSGMLWMNNSYLEIVNYPKSLPVPNSNQLKNRFVGIALNIDLSPEQTLEFLIKNKINSSEILNEDVLDKDGKIVTIAKIILLNHYFHDFRIFFVFNTNDFFEKKEKEVSIQKYSNFTKCWISTHESLKAIELFAKIGLISLNEKTYRTSKNQAIEIVDSEHSSTEIISLEIQTHNRSLNILNDLNNES